MIYAAMIYTVSTFVPLAFFHDLWRTLKYRAEFGARFSPDELHVHIGLLIFLSLLYILRKSRHAPLIALAAVGAVQFANELIDFILIIFADDSWNWKSAVKDTVKSIFWPAILAGLLKHSHPDFQTDFRNKPAPK